VALIESLEASKLLATEIGEKVAEAAETEIAINDSRNKYRCGLLDSACEVPCRQCCMLTITVPLICRPVAERGAMLFFLLNSLNKIHAFYQYR
jgi:dynein heavy chain